MLKKILVSVAIIATVASPVYATGIGEQLSKLFGSFPYILGDGTITKLDQWSSTSSPLNAITQHVFGKQVFITATTTIGDYNNYLQIGAFNYSGGIIPMLKSVIAGTQNVLGVNFGLAIKEDRNANANPVLYFSNDDVTSVGQISMATSTQAFDIQSGATTTANKGIDISDGCFAISGACIGGSGGTNYWTYVAPFLLPASSSPILSRDWPFYSLSDTVSGLFMASLDGSISALMSFSSSTDAISFSNATGGYNFDGPINNSTTTATSTFQGPIAMSAAKIGSLTGFLKATAGVVSTSLIDLAADVTGTLPIANGGTGTTTFANTGVIFSDGTKLTQDVPNFNWDDTNNRLGVGSSSPQSTLSVGAEAGVSPFAIGSSTNSIMYVNSSGFVGFGEPNPLRRVVIRNDINAPNTVLALYNANTTDGNGPVYSFRSDTTGAGATPFTEFGAIRGEATIHDHATRVGTLRAFVQDGATLKQPLTLQKGNVGVSSSTPNWPLSVTGKTVIDGHLQVGNKSDFSDLDKAIAMFGTSTNSYGYIGVQNLNNGPTASADFIWGNDQNATPYTYYADCGLTSSANNDPLYTAFTGGSSFYCYNTDGSMNFAAATTTSNGMFSWTTGSTLINGRKMVLLNNGNVGIGATTTTNVDTLLTLGTSTSDTTVNGLKIYAKGFALGDHPVPCITFAGALSTLAPNSIFDAGRLCSGVPGTGSGYGRARIIGQLPTAAGTYFDAFTVGQNNAAGNSSVNFGIASSTPWATLAVNPTAGDANQFVVGSSTQTSFLINNKDWVGVGTTTPFAKLSLKGDGTGTGLNFLTAGSGNAIGLTVLDSGRVGIGTTTPNRFLTIAPPGVRGELLLFDGSATVDTSTQGGTYISSDNGKLNIQGMDSQGSGTASFFTIDQVNARIGIGTTSPISTMLMVTGGTANNSNAVNIVPASSGDKLLNIDGTSIQGYVTSLGLGAGKATANISLQSDFGGNVLMGTTTGNRRLISYDTLAQLGLSNGAGVAQWWFRNAGSNFYLATTTVAGTATSSLSAFSIMGSSGNTGVASDTPWKTFSVNGTGAWNGLEAAESGSVTVCVNSTTKKLTAGSSATTCAPSNRNAKRDITDSTVGLNDLMKLEPVTFYFKQGEKQQQLGFIVEDVKDVDFRLVQLSATGTPTGIRYDNLASVIVKSIQEQQKQIENLKLGKVVVEAKRSAEENWQWFVIALLALGLIGQQLQINRLKK